MLLDQPSQLAVEVVLEVLGHMMAVDPVAVANGEEVVVLDTEDVGVLEALVLVDFGGFAGDVPGASLHSDVCHVGGMVDLEFLGVVGWGFFKGGPSGVAVGDGLLFLDLEAALPFVDFELLFEVFDVLVKLELGNGGEGVDDFFEVGYGGLGLEVVLVGEEVFGGGDHVDHADDAGVVGEVDGWRGEVDFGFDLRAKVDIDMIEIDVLNLNLLLR